ncbi:unnamed protein product [Rhizophagus irregularis]|nr:unnamed protein product [Rhizophagus irregularis]
MVRLPRNKEMNVGSPYHSFIKCYNENRCFQTENAKNLQYRKQILIFPKMTKRPGAFKVDARGFKNISQFTTYFSRLNLIIQRPETWIFSSSVYPQLNHVKLKN